MVLESAVHNYDEVQHFKASAALTPANSQGLMVLNTDAGLIQAIADNFEANIPSQNGLHSTHGPGGIIGITLQQSVLKHQAYSLYTCCQLTKDEAGK